MAALQQAPQELPVALRALRLKDRALVPVEVQPPERVEDLLDVLRRRSLAVGIFDSQYQRAAVAAG